VTEVSLPNDKRRTAFRKVVLPDQNETMAHVLRSVRHLANHLSRSFTSTPRRTGA